MRIFKQPIKLLFKFFTSKKNSSNHTGRNNKAGILSLNTTIYKTLFNSCTCPILILMDEKVVDCNQKALEFFGFDSKEHFLRSSLIELSPIKQKNGKDSNQLLLDYISFAYKVNNQVFEWQFQRKDGYALICEIYMNVVDIGHKKYLQAYIIDITEKETCRNELTKARMGAMEADKLKSAFLANMSHEIRTPMNAIIGFSQLLTNSNLTKEKKEQYINIIHINSQNLLSLIDDIIDIAKIESGLLNIKEDQTNLAVLFDELDKQYKDFIINTSKENIELKFDLPDVEKVGIISCDFKRLKQVLSYLIDNAIKFTYFGEITCGFNLSQKGFIQFYVKDTGIGINKENLSIIFESFRQGHQMEDKIFGGTGLGLSIAKNLVHNLGGEIWVESVEGKGSEFYFTIPYRPAILHKKQNDNADFSTLN